MRHAQLKYFASTGDNQVVQATGEGTLWGIIFGDTTSVVEVSDHGSDGDGNLIASFNGNPGGFVPFNYRFLSGVTLDIQTAGRVTVLYGP